MRVDLGGRRIIKKNFFQAEDGIRDCPRSRGLGDVYKRQPLTFPDTWVGLLEGVTLSVALLDIIRLC